MGVEILEGSGKGGQYFLVKMGGGGNPYRGLVYRRRGGEHCFSLIMNGFCSNNVLYK